MSIAFDNSYARLPDRFFARVRPTPVAKPERLAINAPLAERLNVSPEELQSPEGIDILAGNRIADRSEPIALAYAGHQFGGFVPQLGDGRAILLGEVIGRDGKRYDVQLKGAGPTPFSRGGDGRAALGPVLREYVVSEAMAAMGVPTTRALAAVATGEVVVREKLLPGAILTRIASSHLRIGTFQYFAVRKDNDAIRTLADYALKRHYPDLPVTEGPGLTLLDAVMAAQINLVATWLSIGFVHGVMNTDNSSIAGETIDYGPCAFLDAYHPGRTFSSIDRGGRYAFANQPRIALWNLTRFAETLLPLVHDDIDKAAEILTKRLETYPDKFEAAYGKRMRAKIGLSDEIEGDLELAQGLLERMAEAKVDYTNCFRRLVDVAAGKDESVLVELFAEPRPIQEWLRSWRLRFERDSIAPEERMAQMRKSNPAFIPRNHRIEEMIAAATSGDMQPFERLMRVLARPFDDQPEAADLTMPPGDEQWNYRTFCGT
ncbi:MAG TPA: YdiU family protein [Polyangium sp.]|nr:YdiU family protein [Polyangium sp.]